jgi:uncharacterized protein
MADSLTAKRPFGKTGVDVPIIGYGTAPLGKENVAEEHAVRCLNRAIDLGITYLDTSPDYGSEPHVGQVMRTRRDEVFLATKVNNRSKDGVLDELKASLRALRTDHVDLIQVHAVNAWADLEQALAPDGAVAALEQARQEGLARFIGITGHARPEILAEGLRRYPFDTVLVALGMPDHLVSAPDRFVLPVAQEKGAGVVAMKVYGHGTITYRGLALRFSLGLPAVSLAILGMKAIEEIEDNVSLANLVRPLEDREREILFNEVRPLVEKDMKESQEGKSDLFWLHDTQVTGWKQRDEPVLVA